MELPVPELPALPKFSLGGSCGGSISGADSSSGGIPHLQLALPPQVVFLVTSSVSGISGPVGSSGGITSPNTSSVDSSSAPGSGLTSCVVSGSGGSISSVGAVSVSSGISGSVASASGCGLTSVLGPSSDRLLSSSLVALRLAGSWHIVLPVSSSGGIVWFCFWLVMRFLQLVSLCLW